MIRGAAQRTAGKRETDFQALHVPVPPSVNSLYKNVSGRGRVKTKDYSAWFANARNVVRLQKPGVVRGPVVIILCVDRQGVGSDLDNRVKALFDLIVKLGVIEDDSKVLAFCTAWAPKTPESVVRLAIMRACDFSVKYRLHADGASGGWFLDAPTNEDA